MIESYTTNLHRVFHFPCLSLCFSNYRGEGGALEEQVTDPPPVRPAQINWRRRFSYYFSVTYPSRCCCLQPSYKIQYNGLIRLVHH